MLPREQTDRLLNQLRFWIWTDVFFFLASATLGGFVNNPIQKVMLIVSSACCSWSFGSDLAHYLSRRAALKRGDP